MKKKPAASKAQPSSPTEKSTTRYEALAGQLKQRIYTGEWKPGALIPAESELALDYEVALGTMRQAIQTLVEEKLLQRRHGHGTMVSKGLTGNTILRFFRFGRGMINADMPTARILAKETIATPDHLSDVFEGRPRKLLVVERVRMVGDKPRLSEKIWVPLPTFSALTRLPGTAWADRLYPMYAQRCNIVVLKAHDHLHVREMSASESRGLELKRGHPGLVVQRRSFDLKGHCVEFRMAVADAYEFDLERPIVE